MLRFLFGWLICLCIACGPPTPRASLAVQQFPIGPAWAQNSVNAVIFRRHAVFTHKQHQYAAYYDSAGQVLLARRHLDEKTWDLHETGLYGRVKDAHNSISLAVDGEGFLHLAWDHHGDSLHYARGKAPGSLGLEVQAGMVGREESRVTYPEFHRFSDGSLLFAYRDGASGNGNLVLNSYDPASAQWRRLQNKLIDGEGQRNAYWQLFIDAQDQIHLSWVWREGPGVQTNHDLAYARSTDRGNTWTQIDGQPYQLPITQSRAAYAWRIPPEQELINQTSMTADAQGRPYIATYWRADSLPQVQLVYHDGANWKRVAVSTRTENFQLAGGGSKRIPISRPLVLCQESQDGPKLLVVYRDEAEGGKALLANHEPGNLNTWYRQALAVDDLMAWEPCADPIRWQRDGVMALFWQTVGQGDGESLEQLPPTMAGVLEHRVH